MVRTVKKSFKNFRVGYFFAPMLTVLCLAFPSTALAVAPVANAQTIYVASGTEQLFWCNYSDSDTSASNMTFTIVPGSGPFHGTLQSYDDRSGLLLYPKYYYYKRDVGYEGEDSFRWYCSDGTSTSTTVTCTVGGNDAPPIAKDQSVTMVEGTYKKYFDLSYTNPPGSSMSSFTLLSTLQNIFLEAWSLKDGAYVRQDVEVGVPVFISRWFCTPKAGFAGTEAFTWKGTNSLGLNSGIATCTFIVNENTAPVANIQNFTVKANTRTALNLSKNDVDSDQVYSYTRMEAPKHGTLEVSSNSNTWYYTADSDYVGPDSFKWKCNDGFSDSNTATYSILVEAVTPVPFENDIVLEPQGGIFKAPFTGGGGTTMTLSVYPNVSNGSLVVDGTNFAYTPDSGSVTHDSFKWKISYDMNDGTGVQVTEYVLCTLLLAERTKDWPTFRADAYRSATTLHSIPDPADLHLQWERDLPAPRQAWKGVDGGGGREMTYHIDLSHEPIVMDHTLVVGLNRDGSVRAYDTRNGDELWRMYTDGPVRQAPVAHRLSSGRVVIVVPSDDGCLYGLDMDDGSVLWKHRGMPSKRKVNGNRRIISSWPLRGGPMVLGGSVYYAGGMMAVDGTFVESLDVETGDVQWRHDNTDMGNYKFPFNPQGYLVRSSLHDRSFWAPSSEWRPRLFNLDANPAQTGFDEVKPLGSATYYDGSGWAVNHRGIGLGIDISARLIGAFFKGRGVWPKEITAGGVVYTGKQPEVVGTVHSVVAADDRLFVMTEGGQLYCFGGAVVANPPYIGNVITALPTVNDTWTTGVSDMLAESSLDGIKGMAYVWGLNSGRAVKELISQSTLSILAIDPDLVRANALRDELGAADVHGPRSNILVDTCTEAYLPPYMARLIVCEDVIRAGYNEGESFVAELFRCLRPYGGAAWLLTNSAQHSVIEGWVSSAGLQQAQVERNGNFTVIRRVGALPGSLDKFSKADGPVIQRDDLVKGSLGTLWWNFDLPWYSLNINNHDTGSYKPPQPEIISGKIITVQGIYNYAMYSGSTAVISKYGRGESIVVDAYTGRLSGETGTHQGSIDETYRVDIGMAVNPGDQGISPSQPRLNETYGVLEPMTPSTTISFHSGRYRGGSGSQGLGLYSHETGSFVVGLGRAGDQGANFMIAANGVMSVLEAGYCAFSTCARAIHTPMGLVHVPELVNWCINSSNRIHTAVEDEAMRNVAVNFGAPHDFIAKDGEQWMHQPYRHDILVGNVSYYETEISPWPPQTYYRHPLTVDAGQSSSAVVSSGIVGVEQIRFPMTYPATAQWTDSAVVVDGSLTDSCWDGVDEIKLRRQEAKTQSRAENQVLEFTAHGGKALLRYDSEYLYIACESNTARSPFGVWRVSLSDRNQVLASGSRRYLDLKMTVSGMKTSTLGHMYGVIDRVPFKLSKTIWTESWEGAVVDNGNLGSSAEFKISWESLSKAGLNWEELLINVVAPNFAHVRNPYAYNMEGSTGEDPGKAFVPVFYGDRSGLLSEERSYTVRLHFVEPVRKAVVGDRVFGVALQGTQVLNNFDIVQEAGASNKGVTREFPGILIRDELVLDLTKVTGDTVIAGIEIEAEYANNRNHAPMIDIYPLIDKGAPTSILVGKKTAFTLRSLTLDPDGDALSFKWEFDGVEITEGIFAESKRNGNIWRLSGYTYEPLEADVGQHELTATADDGRGGIDTYTWLISVTGVNAIPEAILSASVMSGEAPLNVVFDSSNSVDTGGSIASRLWNFGDGSTSTSSNENHTFTEAGSYEVKLTVTDNLGAKAISKVMINVIAEPGARAPLVTSSLVAQATTGESFSYTITASGTAPITYSASGLPTGLDLIGNVISGVPLSEGTFNIELSATNSVDTDTKTLILTVNLETNNVPVVSLDSPSDGASYTAPASVSINASASDDGSVSKVEFYNGAVKLGEDLASPYAYIWNNVSAGNYSITAKATDDEGASTTSSAVSITVSDVVVDPNQVTVDVSYTGTGTGSVTLSPVGGTYDEGTEVTLTPVASTDSDFISWSGALSGSTEPESITVNANISVTATFDLSVVGDTTEVIVDNLDAVIVGAWLSKAYTAYGDYEGSGYLQINKTEGVTDSVTFTPAIPTAGEWEVYHNNQTGSYGATNTNVVVVHAGGSSETTINQRTDRGWVLVGTYSFNAGASGSLKISNQGVDVSRTVYADAVKFVRVGDIQGPVNNAPVGTAQNVSVNEDASLSITLSGTDAENDNLTYSNTQPSEGALSGTAPNLVYTPSANFNGSDSFTFTVDDGQGGSDTAIISITVNAVNDAPTATASATPLSGTTPLNVNFTGTSSDIDSGSLSYSWDFGDGSSSTQQNPSHTYSTANTFTATLTVSDGSLSDTDTVAISVTDPVIINTDPVATAQNVSVNEDGSLNIALSGTDMDNDNLTYSNTQPSEGALSGTAPNLVYTPSANFNGSDSFAFTVDDGQGGSDTETVSITVNAVNDTPIATASGLPTTGTVPFVVNFSGSASDIDSSSFTYSWDFGDGSSSTAQNPSHTYGTVNTFTATLTVSDGNLSDTDTVAITASAPSTGDHIPGDVTLKALDQNGDPATDAEIEVRTSKYSSGITYSHGADISLTVGANYWLLGKTLGLTGSTVEVTILESTTELSVEFQKVTLKAQNQNAVDVPSAGIFLSNSLYSRALEVSPFAHNSSVIIPKGSALFVGVTASGLTGSKKAVSLVGNGPFVAIGDIYEVPVVVLDQLGQAVPDAGVAILNSNYGRHIAGSPFQTGGMVQVPEGSILYVTGSVGSIVGSRTQTVFNTGLENIGEGLFYSPIFKAVASDGTTVIPDSIIEIYGASIPNFNNNTRRGVGIPGEYRFRVRYDGGRIADVSVVVDSTTDTLVLATSWDANDVDGDGIPNSEDGDYASSKALSKAGDPLWIDMSHDFNNNGISDATDPDVDGDGILNADDGQFITLEDGTEEWLDMSRDFDNDGISNCADTDDDNDGSSDIVEFEKGTNSQGTDSVEDVVVVTPETNPVTVPENDPVDNTEPVVDSTPVVNEINDSTSAPIEAGASAGGGGGGCFIGL